MTTIAIFALGYSIGQCVALLAIAVLIANHEHRHQI